MRPKRPNGHWSILENCKAEALQFSTRSEWQTANPLSYRWAAKNGWLDECSADMLEIRKPNGYWTLEKCKEESLKFKTKVEWRTTHRASFTKANKSGWLTTCCEHMDISPLWFGPSSILEFLLSHDIQYLAEHRFKGFSEVARRPFDFYLPDFDLVIEFHGDQHRIGWGRRVDDAKSIQERDLSKKDWALGQRIEYLEIKQWDISSKEDIQSKVLQKLEEISKKNKNKLTLVKRGLTPAEIQKSTSRVKWTLVACKAESGKHETIKEWRFASEGSYQAAFKKGWLAACTDHMDRLLAPKNYWSLDRCKEDAKKYKTKVEWSKAKPSGYSVAVSRGWVPECTEHMSDARKTNPQRLWTYEKCIDLARQCSTRAEFKRSSGSAYLRARIKGWLEDCCAHMNKK